MSISWKPVSKTAVALGVGAAALLWAQALVGQSGFLVLDYVNLPIHEAGHLLFGVFGPTLGIWGGTLLQLLVPALFLLYFALRAETTGASFGAFWLGENLLYVATYIADARAMQLPLVGGGEHDWNIILSKLHLLRSDTAIADVVRFLGWAIMLGAVVFLFSKKDRSVAKQRAVPDEGERPRENIREPKNLDRRA